jgi:hypothetical protein
MADILVGPGEVCSPALPESAPQPQRGPGGLHGLGDHLEQLGVQGVQVDLVAQAGRERLDGPGGVVATAVKRRSTTA